MPVLCCCAARLTPLALAYVSLSAMLIMRTAHITVRLRYQIVNALRPLLTAQEKDGLYAKW